MREDDGERYFRVSEFEAGLLAGDPKKWHEKTKLLDQRTAARMNLTGKEEKEKENGQGSEVILHNFEDGENNAFIVTGYLNELGHVRADVSTMLKKVKLTDEQISLLRASKKDTNKE